LSAAGADRTVTAMTSRRLVLWSTNDDFLVATTRTLSPLALVVGARSREEAAIAMDVDARILSPFPHVALGRPPQRFEPWRD